MARRRVEPRSAHVLRARTRVEEKLALRRRLGPRRRITVVAHLLVTPSTTTCELSFCSFRQTPRESRPTGGDHSCRLTRWARSCIRGGTRKMRSRWILLTSTQILSTCIRPSATPAAPLPSATPSETARVRLRRLRPKPRSEEGALVTNKQLDTELYDIGLLDEDNSILVQELLEPCLV